MPIFTGNFGNTTPTDLLFEIARGSIPGVSTEFVFGFNPDVDIAAEETVWDQGGTYTYLTVDTELFISSSSAADTNIVLDLEGMTADFVKKNIQVTFTNGQTQQSIGSFFRFFKATVVGGSAPAGDLYVAQTDTLTAGVPDTASKIKAKMVQGINVTRSGVLTVPVNHSIYITIIIAHTRKNKSGVLRPVLRAQGAPDFIETTQFPTFESSAMFPFTPAYRIDEKTDIELKANADANGTESVGKFQYILIDNTIA